MGKLKLKWEQISTALERFHDSILYLEQSDSFAQKIEAIDDEDMYLTLRDSVVKRFEFCSDLFWKYLKRYLTDKLQQKLEFNAPNPVIRAAHKAKMLTEADTETFLNMIKDRNMTSHIYRDEIAEQISSRTPLYYKLMKKYIEKLTPQ